MLEPGTRVLIDVDGRPDPDFTGAPEGEVIHVNFGQGLATVRHIDSNEVEMYALDRLLEV